MSIRYSVAVPLTLLLCALVPVAPAEEYDAVLAQELADKGWIVYSAQADTATWDLFVIRPDGLPARRLTRTTRYEEAAPRFSPDGSRILYRRFPKDSVIDHDKGGFGGELVIAKSDGTDARVVGAEGEYPWASWMPDGKHVSCLYRKGIRIISVESGEVVREMPRKGIF
ncbi:MAG: hypothetical protein L3K26_17925, partial [Candidatus Hydrogenedentes bacterium]|nr:hypothetical protein [Candidatus Hydrogenedentota bacterium]